MSEKTDNREFLKRTTLQDLLNQKNVLTPLDNPQKRENSHIGGKNSFLEEKTSKLEEISLFIFKRGVNELKQEKYCCASALFETLLTFEPDHIKAKLNLAVALSQVGNNKKALAILESVLEQEPDNEVAIQNIKIIEESI
ncbi:MAG: tetratricopeptide repeat protein [Desulfamplus sp.]|nr:tetratricopeptide repeat protein [Desulfamplus sp.]